MVKVGDVLWLFAGTINNPKDKMHVCVCVAEGWFLRINSRGHWPGSFPLASADHPFLDHDSFLECGSQVAFDDYIIGQALEEEYRNPAGSLPKATIRALITFIPTVRQLTKTEQDRIIAELTAAL